jgi:hypothetical protein
MVLKIFSGLFLVQLVLSMSCDQKTEVMKNAGKIPVIIHNGNPVKETAEKCGEFSDAIIQSLSSSDDVYELLVTDNLIESVKKEQYVEVIYGESFAVKAGNSELNIDRILIPLSGKFSSGGQATFFTGKEKYDNTPLVNSKGSAMIIEALGNLRN